jgi:hypothetical protein
LPIDEVDSYNGDLVVAMAKVAAGHMTWKSSDFAENLFKLNPKTLENCEKGWVPSPCL